MPRIAYLVYGGIAYAIFFATFLYLIAFVGAPPVVPHTVDAGGDIRPIPAAAAINLGLVAIFAVQHSVMARPAFKRWWKRIVPEPIERSTYVLFASAALILLFWAWAPLPQTIWRVDQPVAAAILWALFALGWVIVLVSTFLINHFELFGLRQVWLHLRARTAEPPELRQPFFYRLVRHPLYSGFFLAFWATPHMTLGHLLLALGTSTFMLIAIRFEERDLIDNFGQAYVDYRSKTGMLTPRLIRR